MRKVVINGCYGGFGLSAKAHARLAELMGRECYFFCHPASPFDMSRYDRVTAEEADRRFMFFAFDTPDAVGRFLGDSKGWSSLSLDERRAHNEEYGRHAINPNDLSRDDPLLIQVVEEMGEAANGQCAKLEIVEIPDDVQWQVEEYDGNEWIAEQHRKWP